MKFSLKFLTKVNKGKKKQKKGRGEERKQRNKKEIPFMKLSLKFLTNQTVICHQQTKIIEH
jgi:hypothetical protein